MQNVAEDAAVNPTTEEEVAELEWRLRAAKARLAKQKQDDSITAHRDISTASSLAQLHGLLLLSDSALPLGSFAFSSGLESFLAHQPKHIHNSATFSRFLGLSLSSLASLTLPYVVAGFESPARLDELDNDFDASTTCTVARRASIKQGRALIAVWERSFRTQFSGDNECTSPGQVAHQSLRDFGTALKTSPNSTDEFATSLPNGHLPPLFGAVCAALSIQLEKVLYMYLFNHVKTIVSAGIRASVLGPYQAQGVLASESLRTRLDVIISEELASGRSTAQAGQHVPMMDLWAGRHEIIYSRIFNS